MDLPCALPAILHGIPSESVFPLIFSSTQATILSPANLVDSNEQRDNPVKLSVCPPVLCAANTSLVGQASRASSPRCLFHLRSHLPQPSFFGKRYFRWPATQSPRPETTHSRLKGAEPPPLSRPGPNLNWKKLPYGGPYKSSKNQKILPLSQSLPQLPICFSSSCLSWSLMVGARACVAVDAGTQNASEIRSCVTRTGLDRQKHSTRFYRSVRPFWGLSYQSTRPSYSRGCVCPNR